MVLAAAAAPLAKLGLVAGGRGLAPLLTTALLWPFVLKFAFSFRPIRETGLDMAEALRLFLFQMSQIAFERGGGGGGEARWQRALRLVFERLVHVRRTHSDEETLLALTMHAL